MSEHVIDTVLHVRIEHRPAQFACLAGAIAEAGGLIGDISTIRIGETGLLLKLQERLVPPEPRNSSRRDRRKKEKP